MNQMIIVDIGIYYVVNELIQNVYELIIELIIYLKIKIDRYEQIIDRYEFDELID